MVLRKAYNTLNECVALKSPLFYEDGIKEMEYKETSQEALQRYEEVQTLLTLEEFRSSLAGFTFKGFPPHAWARERQGQANYRQGVC